MELITFSKVVLEKCEVFVQKSLSLKKYFERKKIVQSITHRQNLGAIGQIPYEVSRGNGSCSKEPAHIRTIKNISGN